VLGFSFSPAQFISRTPHHERTFGYVVKFHAQAVCNRTNRIIVITVLVDAVTASFNDIWIYVYVRVITIGIVRYIFSRLCIAR